MRKANIMQDGGQSSPALHLAATEGDTRDGFTVMEQTLSPQFTDSAGAWDIKCEHGRRKTHLLFIFAALLLRECVHAALRGAIKQGACTSLTDLQHESPRRLQDDPPAF